MTVAPPVEPVLPPRRRPWGIVILVAVVLGRYRLDRAAVIAFAGLALVTSKVWLTIGPADLPAPRLFMNLGPWMQLDAYLWQLAATLVVGAVLYAGLWRARMKPDETVTRDPAPSALSGAPG